MTSSWTIPEKTLELQPGMLDPWVMELIVTDRRNGARDVRHIGASFW